MAKLTYPIDIKKPTFPFGEEYYPNKPEPVQAARRSIQVDNIRGLKLRNVLPTPAGFTSFFNPNELTGLNLPPCTEKVFTYKDSLNNNTIVALGVYGAMFSNDGITWDTSEVPTVVAQTAVGNYNVTPNMDKQYVGFTTATITATKPAELGSGNIVELATQSGVDLTQEFVGIPISNTNTYYQAQHITIPYDEAEVYNKLVKFLDPGITTVTVGDTYVLAAEESYGTYTAVTGDTVNTVLQQVVADFSQRTGNNTTGIFAEYVSDTRIKLSATPDYTATELVYGTFYTVPASMPAGTLLGTVNADQVPLDIPTASIGNLGYVVFNAASALTDGDFNIRRSGKYKVGGTHTTVTQDFDGSLNYTAINSILGQPFSVPLTEDLLMLRQYAGVSQTGLTMDIYDTGVALTYSRIGSDSDLNRRAINCYLATTDIVVGRVYILQSKGQTGTYTALAADTIYNVVAGVVAAYNLAGAAVATQHGEQLITTTAVDELFFQPASLATMTASTSNSEYHQVSDFAMKNNFVASNEMGKLYSLQFNTNTPSTNIAYQIRNNGRPCPVTDILGTWTDANYEFTSAQVAAAALAGTPLMVRLTGKQLTIRARNLGGGVIGGYGFRFRSILTNGALPSVHTGPATTFIQLGYNMTTVQYRCYIKDPIDSKYYSLPWLPLSTGNPVFPVMSPYGENLNAFDPVTGISGIAPDTPTTDVYQLSIPLQTAGEYDVLFKDVADPYTPYSMTLTVDPQAGMVAGATSVSGTNIDTGVTLTNSLSLGAADQAILNVFNPWTIGIIKNRLYCYRNGQGDSTYILRLLLDGTAWEQLTPTFINMAELEGITGVRGRMVAWDTTGSVYLSSVTDPMDFVPSLKTKANVLKIDALRGNVVLCQSFKDGYIVYATDSIILASYVGGTNTFKYTAISTEQGILNADAVVQSDVNAHFVYTQKGLHVISDNGMQEVSPEVSSYLKTSKLSPKLNYIANRYLSISFSPEQSTEVVSRWHNVPSQTIDFPSEYFWIPNHRSFWYVKVPVLNPNMRTAAVTLEISYWSQPSTTTQTGLISTVHAPLGEIPVFQSGSTSSFITRFNEAVNAQVRAYMPTRKVDVYVGVNAQYPWTIFTPTLITFLDDNWVTQDVYIDSQFSSRLPELMKDFITTAHSMQAQLHWFQIYGQNFWDGGTNVHDTFTHVQQRLSYLKIDLTYTNLDYTLDIMPQAGIASLNIRQIDYDITHNDNEIIFQKGNTYSYGFPDYTNKLQGLVTGFGTIPIGGGIAIPAIAKPYAEPRIKFDYKLGAGHGGFVDITNYTLEGVKIWTAGKSVGYGFTGYSSLYLDSYNKSLQVAIVRSLFIEFFAIPGLPSITIPGSTFVTTGGATQNPDPIYTRALVLDLELKNWGSMDTQFRHVIDYSPVNARSINPVTSEVTMNSFTYKNLASAFGVMLKNGTLNLCDQDNTDSYIEIGDIGFSNSGMTRFLESLAEFVTVTDARLELIGSLNGNTLEKNLYISTTATNGLARLYTVLTGKWFRIRVSGRFHVKNLNFSGELGGNR